ncbi:MAG: glycosyltransferase family 39 protein, partial [Gloeobacteraceae cyanobacterium ES-bin-316]|nr:glycosyltransferase family 39 protein [Ferruginibacter sp.]
MTSSQLSKYSFSFLSGLIICLNFTGLFNEVMEPDGALYASLAKEIANSGNWINLWVRGADWLDKPHLPFWLAALSFKILGVSAFAYKLPSFILFLVSLFYCFKIASHLYSENIARLATLIYATALHTIISNFDGKVEIYLTAFVIAAMYHMCKAFEKKWVGHIVAAAFFAACAVMTKGIFILITIAAGFVIFWIKTKQWKEFLQLKWYVFVFLVLVFILPELYALYAQFDLHPEKTVYGKTNVSGLRFFFWDSQFGRFLNNGPIRGKGDPSFFLHTSLWTFLPWSITLVLAVINVFKQKKTPPTNYSRWIIGGTALISFLLFTISKFQLPHYIVILFPHFAMITAAYLIETASEQTLKKINIVQTVLLLLLVLMITGILIVYSFPSGIFFIGIMLIAVAICFLYKKQILLFGIMKKNIAFAVILAIFLNCLLYPSLLKYQSGMMAGKWLNEQEPRRDVIFYKSLSYSFDFYYKGKVDYSNPDTAVIQNAAKNDSLILFTPLSALKDFNTDSVN